MKYIYGFVALIGAILLAAAIMPKDYSVITEVEVNLPQKEVRDYIKLLKNQNEYSVWFKLDPNMAQSYSGIDNTTGFSNYWSGNSDAGEGNQTIIKIIDGESYEVKIDFIRPFKSTSFATTRVEKLSNEQTKIISSLSGHDSWPINIITPMFIKPMLRKDMQQNLDNIKRILQGSGDQLSSIATK